MTNVVQLPFYIKQLSYYTQPLSFFD